MNPETETLPDKFVDLTINGKEYRLPETLNVTVTPDTVGYIAKCAEIDYFAAGETSEDAMERFEKGFVLTLKAHINKFGSLDNFLKQRVKPLPEPPR